MSLQAAHKRGLIDDENGPVMFNNIKSRHVLNNHLAVVKWVEKEI